MTAPLPQTSEQDIERQVAARTAELADLLGHVTHCWDEERRLLARQLHDSLGSTLTALTMHLTLLNQQLPNEKNLHHRSAQMKQLLLNIIETNRQMQLALWNDKLEFLGIKAALGELVSEFGAQHKMIARISLPEQDLSYPRTHGVALLRCLEEGLRNVARHAQASEVDVVLDDNEEEIMLTVRDNGVGLANAASGENGCHGVRLVRERARYLGGTLSLQAAPAGGTVLSMTLPSAPAPATAA
ncbi:MAG: ATP-binding protein [Massilia sp.]